MCSEELLSGGHVNNDKRTQASHYSTVILVIAPSHDILYSFINYFYFLAKYQGCEG